MTTIFIQCEKKTRPRKALDLKAGDKVMRKSEKDLRLAIGEVEWVSNGRARIKWPAPRRIGGESHHSTVKLTSRDLMLATPLAIAERVVDVRLARVRSAMRSLTQYGKRDGDAYYERQIEIATRRLLEAAREFDALKQSA